MHFGEYCVHPPYYFLENYFYHFYYFYYFYIFYYFSRPYWKKYPVRLYFKTILDSSNFLEVGYSPFSRYLYQAQRNKDIYEFHVLKWKIIQGIWVWLFKYYMVYSIFQSVFTKSNKYSLGWKANFNLKTNQNAILV